MGRTLAILGGVLGATAVALGAFGAHALKSRLLGVPTGAERLAWWSTAAHYHLVHALAVMITAWLADRGPSGSSTVAGFCFAGGVLLFSGSLYLMALTSVRVFGAITPFGGALLLAGWVAVIVSAIRIAR